jgi:hypothetical protein
MASLVGTINPFRLRHRRGRYRCEGRAITDMPPTIVMAAYPARICGLSATYVWFGLASVT